MPPLRLLTSMVLRAARQTPTDGLVQDAAHTNK